MTLSFGLINEGANIQTADYKSAGSHQHETLIYAETGDANYHLVYTVPAGMTFYVSSLFFSTDSGDRIGVAIATGNAASEVINLAIHIISGQNFTSPLVTPINFAADTKISVRGSVGVGCLFNLVGWIE